MIDIKKGNLRLTNIVKMDLKNYLGYSEKEEKEGLSIERKNKNDSGYLVIAFIKYNEESEYSDIQIFGDRIQYIEPFELEDFHSLMMIGVDIVNMLNSGV